MGHAERVREEGPGKGRRKVAGEAEEVVGGVVHERALKAKPIPAEKANPAKLHVLGEILQIDERSSGRQGWRRRLGGQAQEEVGAPSRDGGWRLKLATASNWFAETRFR
jgi:hypothetical protein